jgi:hypothetical protein
VEVKLYPFLNSVLEESEMASFKLRRPCQWDSLDRRVVMHRVDLNAAVKEEIAVLSGN